MTADKGTEVRIQAESNCRSLTETAVLRVILLLKYSSVARDMLWRELCLWRAREAGWSPIFWQVPARSYRYNDDAMQSPSEIENEIVSFIQSELVYNRSASIDIEESLFASGLLDSIGIMRLISHLETTFEVKIPPKDLVPDHFRTVKVMAAYMYRLSNN